MDQKSMAFAMLFSFSMELLQDPGTFNNYNSRHTTKSREARPWGNG
jgi:hypothetical protein